MDSLRAFGIGSGASKDGPDAQSAVVVRCWCNARVAPPMPGSLALWVPAKGLVWSQGMVTLTDGGYPQS